MEKIFEYSSSCTNCAKKVNQYTSLMKKIDDYKGILNLELPVYHNEYCVSEKSICYQIESNDNFAKTHAKTFIIEYIECIKDIYLNSPI
jgi:hypothetical protein